MCSGDINDSFQGNVTALKTIDQIDRNKDIVTSFAQQRLWFLDQLESKSALYNIPLVFRLGGQLSYLALERSLTVILERHETLRTTFNNRQGVAYQIIHPATTVLDLKPVDISIDQLENVLQQEILKSFDLNLGPLIRICLFKLAEQEHVLSIVQHHIISDGWSVGILIKELSDLYTAAIAEKPLALPPLSIQYADFAAWQRQWIKQSGKLQSQLNYWKKHLDGVCPLALPTDFTRPASRTYSGKNYLSHFDPNLLASLQSFCKKTQSSLFMILLGAFNVLLKRYSGQDDITIGIPIANRVRKELEPLIGFFVNTLAIRNNLGNNPRFIDFLSQVRDVCLDAYVNQDVPFDYVVDTLQIERIANRAPIFDVMFVLQNAGHNASLTLPGLKVETITTHDGVAKFDLVFSLEESEHQLNCKVEYNTDLYQEATIQRMVEHYKRLLHAIAADPNIRIAQLQLLTDKEQDQLMVQWNATQHAFPKNKTFQQLFEAQVEKTPNHIAAVFEGQILTYHQLNEKANQLAHALREKYFGKNKKMLQADVPIGLCLNRGFGLVIGMMGILKAGGAYLPLDPHYPAERLNYMLNDSDVQFVLAEEETLPVIDSILPQAGEALVLNELINQPVGREAKNNPTLLNQAQDLAYIIYTSGSTGKPKGVMVEHHSLVNFAYSYKKITGLNAKSRVLGFSTINFDAAIIDYYASLASGAGIWIVSEELRKDVNRLTDFIEDNRLTHGLLPPAVLSLMPKRELGDLEVLVVGGESCAKGVMDRWSANRTLINAYGPTEGTVCATYSIYEPHKSNNQIGHFLPNVQGYVLDKHLQVLPIGVAGELYIGGAGIARGYINQPALTEERFIANPFVSVKETAEGKNLRLYKTGDLVRWLPTGELEFLGRIDDQVKIRGLRIELGEIEAQLGKYSEIDQCIVVLQELREEKTIVAYFTAAEPSGIEINALRQYLSKHLPEYMVPTFFVAMDTLPVTVNGKVDKKNLPLPDVSDLNKDRYIGAETEEEKALTEIWESLLEIKPISVNANFFHLGGHSLKATQLAARIQEAFQIECPVKAIFEYPTIRALGNFIVQRNHTLQYKPFLVFNQNGCKPPLFLVHPGGGGAAAYIELAAQLDKEQPLYAIESYNLYSGSPMIDSIPALAKQYINYIKSVQPTGPYYLGGWSFGGIVAFEIARQLSAQEEQVNNVFLLDSVIFHSCSNMQTSQFDSIIDAELEQNEWTQTLPAHEVKRIIDVTKNGSNATLHYQIDQPYIGQVTLFKAMIIPDTQANDRSENMQGLQILKNILASGDNGWGAVAPYLSIVHANVTHKDMLKGENAKLMAELIAQVLGQEE